jgi:hypothetical protein
MSPWLATNRKPLPVPESRLKLAPNTADERCRVISEFIRGRDYRLSRPHGLQGA